MKRHYIKIPASVSTWVPGGALGDWRGDIVRDMTGDGRVAVERLDPNERGVRAAIHGDRYCVEIGKDRDPGRADVLFLMRVESAEGRLPRRQPVTLERSFLLWPGGFPPEVDRLDDLFGVESESVQAAAVDSYTDVEAATEPSPLLKGLLAAASERLRQHVRPGTDVDAAEEPHSFLRPFRQLWSRYRLDRHVQLSPRHDALIRSRVTPQSLPGVEREALTHAFGIGMLNRLALADDGQVPPIVEAMAAMAIAPAVRATVWISTLEALTSGELRRELHESAEGLSLLVDDTSEVGRAWRSVAVPGLIEVAKRTDQALRDAIGELDASSDGLGVIASWAKGLVFTETRTETVSAETRAHGDNVPLFATAPIESAPPQPVIDVAPSVADEWVINLRVPEKEPLEGLRLAVAKAAQELQGSSAPIASVEGLAAFHSLVEGLEARTKEWREAVGDINQLRLDLEEARRALERLEGAVGPAARELIREHITPDDAMDIADLLANRFLQYAPVWLLSSELDDDDISTPPTPAGWGSLLVDRQRRQLVKLFCDLAAELNEPEAIQWIATPSAGQDPERHLREWFDRVRDFLLEVPPEMRALVAQGGADFRTVHQQALRLSQLRKELPTAIWPEIEHHLSAVDQSERISLLAAYEQAVTFCREQFGSLDDLPHAMLKARVAKEMSRGAAIPKSAASVGTGRVIVDHNFLEGRTARATLLFASAESGEDYGFVSVPLVLETDQPRSLTVRLKWEFKGDARSAWSRDWPGPEPDEADAISVPVYAWRRQPEPTKWHFSLSARLPIRTPKGANPRLEVEVAVSDADTKQPLGDVRSLRWDSIAIKPVTISVTWGDATEPSHVRDHPIGPQERADAIRERFVAGSSVAVIAPRRFGKSTLVEYLVKEGSRHKLLIPEAVVCTTYASASGFDYEQLWEDVSEQLVDKIGARLKRDTPSVLPSAEAFDAVRATARKKGYRAVVILFDEAQLFFPGQRGNQLGSTLKTLLERHLARGDDPRKAPLLFGLIGLPSLRDRAGADLMGLLNPIEKSRMDEAELRPLITKMTSGLQTTRGARQRLAETAGNLLILRALLEKLAVRATRDRRIWVNYNDVVAVEEALKQDLQDGLEQTVASYIRDVLNAADRVDDWRPIPSLPAAAAWARTWTPGRSEGELRARTLEVLNQWCKLSQSDQQHGIRPVYTNEVLEKHLQQLQERRVLVGSEFASPLLRAWLLSVASRSSFDAAFREALFSGAQRRIKLPSGAAPIAQGAQAAVWRSGPYAYRIRSLGSELERLQFLESADMLEALRLVVQRREAGSDHIFELVDMGLSERDEREAIQVYRWVEGQTLTGREGAYAADIVIELGAKLARGLRLLHRNNILHRDICPRNVVLDDVSDSSTLRPVLIDFGFARLATAPMHTAMAGDHIAPEVRGPRPEWSRAADVYALGSTLLSVLAADDQAPDLRRLLNRVTAERTDERPSAEELLAKFEELETDHKVNERREEAWRELWSLAGEHRHIPWFSAQMNKMRESLVNVALGFYRIPAQRYGVIADFLNQLTETNPILHNSLWGLGMRTGGPAGDILKTLGALRNQHVHGRGNQSDDQRILVQRFQALPAPEQRGEFCRGTDTVASIAQLKGLPAVVLKLLS